MQARVSLCRNRSAPAAMQSETTAALPRDGVPSVLPLFKPTCACFYSSQNASLGIAADCNLYLEKTKRSLDIDPSTHYDVLNVDVNHLVRFEIHNVVS